MSETVEVGAQAVDPLVQANRGKYGHRVWKGDEFALLVEVVPWLERFRVDDWFHVSWFQNPNWPVLWARFQIESAMKKRERKRVEQESRAAEDADFQTSYPTLHDYLTATCYDGDRANPRTVSTLLVFAADGVFKGCLRERDEGVCLWVAGRTFGDLLRVLEDELANDTGVWRADRSYTQPQAVRKPKPKSP